MLLFYFIPVYRFSCANWACINPPWWSPDCKAFTDSSICIFVGSDADVPDKVVVALEPVWLAVADDDDVVFD